MQRRIFAGMFSQNGLADVSSIDIHFSLLASRHFLASKATIIFPSPQIIPGKSTSENSGKVKSHMMLTIPIHWVSASVLVVFSIVFHFLSAFTLFNNTLLGLFLILVDIH